MTPSDALERLVAKSEIHDALVRYCRACDRQDIATMLEAFHPDARINMGYYVGPAEGFCARFAALGNAPDTPLSRIQHQVSNVLCEIDGAFANVESYMRVARRRRGEGGSFDELVAARMLDRFAFRDGRWAVVDRQVIWDWMLSAPATAAYWEGGGDFLVGTRNDDDPSCAVFPRKAYTALTADPQRWKPQP